MPGRILLVEDNALVSGAFSVFFESEGWDVEVAATVTDAVDKGKSSAVDLMLLDLTLPDGDGLDVLDALGRAGSPPRVTLAMTGDKNAATHARCLAAGCADVLIKPVSLRELRDRISRHLA